ncbi:MAG: hypothetical protein ACTSPV_17330 [Candidatus Hodarchaeales archaeon]
MSKSTFQRLSVIINECTTNHLYRLASSLRTVLAELQKIATDDDGGDYNKYVFLLNQTWVLTKGLKKAIQENDSQLIEKYSGQKTNKITIPEMDALLLSLELGLLEEKWLFFKLHFKVLETTKDDDGLKDSIICWTQIFGGTKKISGITEKSLRKYLNFKIKGLNEPIVAFLQPSQSVKLINWIYNPVYKSIECGNKSKCFFKDHVLETYELPVFRKPKLLSHLKSLELTPLDHSHTLTMHTGFVNIKLRKIIDRGDHIEYKFEYDGLTFIIKLSDTITNTKLILELKELRKRKLSYIYGSLNIRGASLYFTPYSIIAKPIKGEPVNLEFLSTKNYNLNYNDASSDNIVVKNKEDKEKNLKILGELLGKK